MSQFLPRSDVCIPLAERVRLDPRRVKAELVELPVARELHKEGLKMPFFLRLLRHFWRAIYFNMIF